MELAFASSVLLASVTVSYRALRSITGRPCAMIPASGNSACAAAVEHNNARTDAPCFDKNRIQIPLLSAIRPKRKGAWPAMPRRSDAFVRNEEPRAPLKLNWVVFDPNGNAKRP